MIKTSVVHLKECSKTTCPEYIPRKCQLPKNSDHTDELIDRGSLSDLFREGILRAQAMVKNGV